MRQAFPENTRGRPRRAQAQKGHERTSLMWLNCLETFGTV